MKTPSKPQKRVKIKAWAIVGHTYRDGELMQEGKKKQHAIFETKKDAEQILENYTIVRHLLKVIPVEISPL